MNTLLYWNIHRRPLAEAVTAAKAAHVRRLGTMPTHVILPIGEYPPTVGGLVVETHLTVKGLYLKVYNGGAADETLL